MSKTIEEAAKDYAYDIGDSDWERMRLQDAFIDGINHIMQLPLCDRLTAKEKERVRKTYKAMSDYGMNKGVECASCANYAARVWMEGIFGADFFKEEE